MGFKDRSSVTLHVGQCGIQCAPMIWSTMLKEHSLDAADKTEFDCPHTVFRELSTGEYIPRTILVDLDPSTIDKIQNSSDKHIFSQHSYVTGTEDAASCYARGRYVQGIEVIPPAREALRRQLEACNICISIIHNCATSGGTGSGIVPDILTAESTLSDRKYTSIGLEIYCSQGRDNALGYYNTVLHMNTMNDLVDLNVILDNDAMYKIADNRCAAVKKQVTFRDINQQVAAAYSCLTAGERFNSENLDIARFKTCLVPYQGLSYVSATISSYSEPQDRNLPVMNLIEDAFGPLTGCSIKRNKGQFFGSYIVLRGKCRMSFESLQAIDHMCEHQGFAPWIPSKFTFARCDKALPSYMPPFNLAGQTVSHFYNHSDITSIFDDYAKWFGVSYARKTFIKWYVDNGMNEQEFNESLESLAILQRVYKSIGKMTAD